MMVIDEIGEPVDLRPVGQSKHGHREHQHGRAKGRDDDDIVLSHAEEEDHRHGEWEYIKIGGLAGSLDIAKEEGLEVGADDAEYFGEFEVTDAMEDHEEAKQKDAGQFDDGAPDHPVVKIIEKIKAVAADGENDKRIQLPEFVPRCMRCTGRGYRMAFHLVVRDQYWI